MRTTLFLLVAAAASLTIAAGCSQNPQIVRGQQPDYCPPGNVVYGDDCDFDDCECDHGPGCCCCRCRPYCIPSDLVYPPPGDMPAIVQYPYYTTKGPDCFFHQ